MILWSIYCGVHGRLLDLAQNIAVGNDGNQDLSQITASVHSIFGKFSNMVWPFRPRPPEQGVTIFGLREMIDSWLSTGPYMILFEYLTRSASLPALPYRWDETLSIISVGFPLRFFAYRYKYERCLGNVVFHERLKETPSQLIPVLLSFWRPDDAIPIPKALIEYLNRWPLESLKRALETGGSIETYLWSNFSVTLSEAHRIVASVLRWQYPSL
jgi:hypothetical protein